MRTVIPVCTCLIFGSLGQQVTQSKSQGRTSWWLHRSSKSSSGLTALGPSRPSRSKGAHSPLRAFAELVLAARPSVAFSLPGPHRTHLGNTALSADRPYEDHAGRTVVNMAIEAEWPYEFRSELVRDDTHFKNIWYSVKKPLLSIGRAGVSESHGNHLRGLLKHHPIVKVKMVRGRDVEKNTRLLAKGSDGVFFAARGMLVLFGRDESCFADTEEEELDTEDMEDSDIELNEVTDEEVDTEDMEDSPAHAKRIRNSRFVGRFDPEFDGSTEDSASSSSAHDASSDKHEPSESFRREELIKAWEILDVDGDGYITTEEFYSVLANIEAELKEEGVQEMVRRADVDGDGQISYNEFVGLLQG